MRNYFENARVNWGNWSPNQVIFKSNSITKKLLPEENVLSWTSKGDRDTQMSKLTGGSKTINQGWNGSSHSYYSRENYKGVMVQLKDVKSEYPSINVDFLDYTERTDSVGNRITNLDILVYINSFHSPFEWVRCPTTNNYIKKHNPNVAPLDEGYRIAYGGQGDINPMSFETFQEVLQISEAVRGFLVNRIVPAKRGEFDFNELMAV